MKGKNSPGRAALGHEPFSKVKLEGPKKKHDDHGPSASVPGKSGARGTPNEHWERHYKMSEVRDTNEVAGTDWNPKIANTRTCTFPRVNREDH